MMNNRKKLDISNEGHRKRFFDRVEKCGTSGLSDHELIEGILFFVFPRRNTNDIAHAVMDRFGSIRGLLDASEAEMMSVPMFGKRCAMLFAFIAELMRRYFRVSGKKEVFNTVEKVGEFFVSRYICVGTEKTYMLLLNNSMRYIDCVLVGEGSINSVAFDAKRAYQYAFERKAANVIIAHNHPEGIAIPTEDDNRTTAMLANGFGCLGINLVEHFIIAGDRYLPIMRNSHNVSMRRTAEERMIFGAGEYTVGKAESIKYGTTQNP